MEFYAPLLPQAQCESVVSNHLDIIYAKDTAEAIRRFCAPICRGDWPLELVELASASFDQTKKLVLPPHRAAAVSCSVFSHPTPTELAPSHPTSSHPIPAPHPTPPHFTPLYPTPPFSTPPHLIPAHRSISFSFSSFSPHLVRSDLIQSDPIRSTQIRPDPI